MRAQAEAISKGVADRVTFRVADANYLPFQDETFDGAIFQASLIFTDKAISHCVNLGQVIVAFRFC